MIIAGIKYGVLVAIARYMYLSIQSLSGQVTVASIVVNLLGKLGISQWAAWVFGGGCLMYAQRQRKLRHDSNEHQGTRVSKLEERIDEKRSSSKLTTRGQTNPRDEI